MQVQIRTRPVPTTLGDVLRGFVTALILVAFWKIMDVIGYESGLWTPVVADYWVVFWAAWSGAFTALRFDREAGKVVLDHDSKKATD